ncbi:hypothetical protein KC350_g38 [Hortaea werneckii]|nr:hypothetical protein KC350_g38 [Hortaea werneckii]
MRIAGTVEGWRCTASPWSLLVLLVMLPNLGRRCSGCCCCHNHLLVLASFAIEATFGRDCASAVFATERALGVWLDRLTFCAPRDWPGETRRLRYRRAFAFGQ